MKKLAWVGVGSVALLGLAMLWSARLVEDVSPTPVEPGPVAVAPRDDVPRARLAPDLLAPPPTTVVAAPTPGAAPTTPTPPPPALPLPPAPGVQPSEERRGELTPPLPDADEPFAEDSKELQYAFRLAESPDSTPDQVRNAAEVFERCLKTQPGDERCYRGLTTAQTRLSPPNVPVAPRKKDDTFVPRPEFHGKGPMKRSPIGR